MYGKFFKFSIKKYDIVQKKEKYMFLYFTRRYIFQLSFKKTRAQVMHKKYL